MQMMRLVSEGGKGKEEKLKNHKWTREPATRKRKTRRNERFDRFDLECIS